MPASAGAQRSRDAEGVLNGVLVVSLEQAVAAPYCSSRLADAGARVIKVERPEGDFARGYDRAVKGESAYFVWLNRGKESIALDLKSEADLALMHRMLARADVYIQNLAPGGAARLGLAPEALRDRHPRLITVSISGYGNDGPYATRRAYDLLVQAESGLASVTGRPEGPGRVGVSVTDVGTGMYAYMAVLEALIGRAADGRGRGIEVSLFDSMAEWMTVPLLHEVYGGQAPRRVGLNHPSIAPYGAYSAVDGEVVVAIQNEREWRRFCTSVLGRPELADDERFSDNPARVSNRPTLDAEIAAVFAGLSRAQLAERLSAADIAYAAVNEVADLARHPQLRRARVDTPSGEVEIVAPPARTSVGAAAPHPVPALDQHGAAIRKEFSHDG
jgi:crotonobetainyl-CoA:carnitine CoA-transferase CaiB-like acyl-CoA transferase